MTRIERQPAAAAQERYDLIVVGGGIYGVFAALESRRAGLRTLLLEKNDYGSGTSFNSLRILHGGLRYLQNMEFKRFRESTAERRWFMSNLPELCRPLRCLMPLYGQGLKRPSVFRAALLMNDTMSWDRNRGVAPQARLGRGRSLGRSQTVEQVPHIDPNGLRGAAQWYDGIMLSSERVQMELHRWAAAAGATQLNYVEAIGIEQSDGKVAAVEAVDRVSGDAIKFETTAVLNCAGGWCREVAERMDRDVPALFPRSLAFNLLLDVEPIGGEAAVAVEPKKPGGRTYFLVPWKGRLHAGTYHMAWEGRDGDDRQPPESAVTDFLDDLNMAVPGLNVSRDDVLHIYAGQLPALAPGAEDMSHHAPFHDHGNGLFSLAGHKYTTARLEASRAVRRVVKTMKLTQREVDQRLVPRPEPVDAPCLHDARDLIGHADAPSLLRRLADEESVVYVNDLIERRLDGVAEPSVLRELQKLAQQVVTEPCALVGGAA